MIRDERVYLTDIIDSIRLIFRYLNEVSEEKLVADPMLQDAVYRRFEIIGEATGRLSEQLRAAYPEVEWRLMKAMRNKIAHEYYMIRAEVVFNTVRKDLPPLLTKLEKIVSDLNSKNSFS